MLGILFGTVCLIGLIKVVRRGHGWGHHGWGGGRFGGGIGRNWMLRRLFQRLDTTPGQEKVIQEAFDNVQKAAYKLKDDLQASRGAVAAAVKGDSFDTAAVNAVFTKQDEGFQELRAQVLAGLQAIHEALNPEQRKLAGELIEFGPRAMHGGYGYGGGCGRGRFAGHHRGFGGGRGWGDRGGESVNL